MTKIWNWLHDRDWKTWLGHGLQGVVITGLALLFGLGFNSALFALFVHAVLREAPGIYFAAKTNNQAKLLDGVLDFLAFFLGYWLALVLFG